MISDSARDIAIFPIKPTYRVGEFINCSATGNPSPSVAITRQSGNQSTLATNGTGFAVLNITEDMDDKEYRCQAHNRLGMVETFLKLSMCSGNGKSILNEYHDKHFLELYKKIERFEPHIMNNALEYLSAIHPACRLSIVEKLQ